MRHVLALVLFIIAIVSFLATYMVLSQEGLSAVQEIEGLITGLICTTALGAVGIMVTIERSKA